MRLIGEGDSMKTVKWLDDNLEEFCMVVLLAAMTLIMGVQVFCRYALGMSLSWSEELTRYLFIWSGFLSVSYCSKKCLSIKIEQFVAIFSRTGRSVFKLVNHTFELVFFSPCIISRQPHLCRFYWLHFGFCSGGSSSFASQGVKVSTTLPIRSAIRRNHLLKRIRRNKICRLLYCFLYL